MEKEELIKALQYTKEKVNRLENDMNKLIRYIAVRENKDFEEVVKEFEIYEEM